MLVQIDQNDGRRHSATTVDLPLNSALSRTLPPVVAVFGYPGRVAALPAHLPTGWTMRYPRDLDDVGPDEIVLFAGATVAEVATARAVLPRRTRIVALVDAEARAEIVAGVLTAGADACVRGGQPSILASHLVACRRRQLADRWAKLQNVAAAQRPV
jgi:hypothetical protein